MYPNFAGIIKVQTFVEYVTSLTELTYRTDNNMTKHTKDVGGTVKTNGVLIRRTSRRSLQAWWAVASGVVILLMSAAFHLQQFPAASLWAWATGVLSNVGTGLLTVGLGFLMLEHWLIYREENS
jgi:protein-S-isoprenylcysteine O-methyltransferase Ste14